MSINRNTDPEECSEPEVGDTEANESTSLLKNVSTKVSSAARADFDLV